MKVYVGLDVGLEETSLCIVDSEGVTVREAKVSTEPQAIRCALEGLRGSPRSRRASRRPRSASGCTANCSRPGVPIIVVEARHMRVSLSTMRNKTDRNDARGIAQMMRLGWYRAVHVREHRHAEDALTSGQQEAAQAQADRHREPHSWHAAGVWLADGCRGSWGLRGTGPGARSSTAIRVFSVDD